MASSKTDIVNLALTAIGNDPINSIDNTDSKSVKCKTHYYNVVEQVLRSGNWSVASARASLARLTDAPEYGYLYAYELPGDCIKLRSMENQEIYSWEKSGSRVLTDSEECKVKYTREINDVSEFDSLLTATIVALLASRLATVFKADPQIANSQFAIYRDLLAEAKLVDGAEQFSSEPEVESWSDR